MKNLGLLILLSGLIINIYAQSIPDNYRKISVNKQLKDFSDEIKYDSPLNCAITLLYLMADGNESLWREASTERIHRNLPPANSTKITIPGEERNKYLNAIIKEVVYYCDSFAFVFWKYTDSLYHGRIFVIEKGKWVQAGGDDRRTIGECNQIFNNYAKINYLQYKQNQRILPVPHDTTAFVNFLKSNGKDPKEFILECLSKHKLVMYGEVHRRLWSWILCKSVINDKRFSENVGTIFMELPSDQQSNIDLFLQKKTPDKELIYQVFRGYLASGWDDKGMFDFIMEVWKVNNQLPDSKKIKIIAADMPRPWSSITTREQSDKLERFPRDTFMAKSVQYYISNKFDNRNFLFIVGVSHICKTRNEAATILASMFSKEDLFTIFTHIPRIYNDEVLHERIRHGMFDIAFARAGNNPVAFYLKGSPHGKEPYDGTMNKFSTGLWEDNYDGYIFLGSLDQEPADYVFYDIYTDEFVKEIDRRMKLWGSGLMESWNIKEVSREAVISKFSEDIQKSRWQDYLTPLNVK